MNGNINIRLLDTDTEQPDVLPLLASCFPDYWEQLAAKNKCFPYDEISFAAFYEGRIVGHCGIIPYRISDGAGRQYFFGGLASVAVSPEARKQGIARNLCLFAMNWAKENGYDSLPLYTGMRSVYESSGWHDYLSTQPKCVVFPFECANVHADAISGEKLPVKVKNQFVSLYEKQDFCGKVLRENRREFHAWPRIFMDPALRFAYGEGITAIFHDGTLAECFAEDNVADIDIYCLLAAYAASGRLNCALHNQSRIWSALKNCGCKMLSCNADTMHGEIIMTLDISNVLPHHNRLIHYSLVDKF